MFLKARSCAPHIAAVLADYLTQLPPTWREDMFSSSHGHPTPSTQARGPETAPYHPGWEDWPACSEAQEPCRYHPRFCDGQDYQSALIKTALTDHTAIVEIQQRHAELNEADAAQPTTAESSTCEHEMKPSGSKAEGAR
ncbi:hypothetical protein [Streptomyces sp. NPDC001165]|uniref:hypothetical protein n=1 Tax=Streptomyces sp. NPDC001165 TaxID=3364546 RepID=UPI003685D298